MPGLVPYDWIAQAVLPPGYSATSPIDAGTGIAEVLLVQDPAPGSTHKMMIGLAPS